MTKLRRHILLWGFLLATLLAGEFTYGQSVQGDRRGYALHTRIVDADSAGSNDQPGIAALGIPGQFDDRAKAVRFLNELQADLQARGYVTASLDTVRYDSAAAYLVIYLGKRYAWDRLDVSQVDPDLLEAVGFQPQQFRNKALDYTQVTDWQERILGFLENNGYPFAKIWLDSFTLKEERLNAVLKLDLGRAYTIDSIRLNGNAKISNEFLQRYLDIRAGTMFSREKLLTVSRRIRELGYVEEETPARLVWLNSGSFLDVYLRQRKSSQVNVLIGFLPNTDQLSSRKLLVTGEANLNLRNSLGAGETIVLNWQQLQVKSPRLHVAYQHPYLFRSPFGLDFSFDMFRKDSTFLNVNFQLGVAYSLDQFRTGKVFFQRFQTIVNGANTAYILTNYRLPDEADMSISNIGVDYEHNRTNYRLNPTSGSEYRVTTTIGTKRIRKNTQVLELKDPNNAGYDFNGLYDSLKLNSYQFRVRAYGARYFPLGKQNRTTLKTALNVGFVQSANLFRNELFQIGGYKLLRGFDEESQYLSRFVIGTAEYRVLVGQNSFFYAFGDGGWGQNTGQNAGDADYGYASGGLGISFETKVGIFNLAWAVGKRSDTEFNLRQSKIHFGFVNYF